ncbi:hypothetical protein Taro_005141 [Colocasia esculenta]|uniref:Aldehyde dehydrogenase n=1 Tax=Colocasia esculenta TaxID=4460 RepID=A0A843TWV3_COLES|nr:hypothetical protein [Colocasia esculenta]
MEGEGRRAFDAEGSAAVVSALRWSYGTGRTRSYEWRADQLRALLRMMEEREGDVLDALRADLGKPGLESFIQEIALAKDACKLALKELIRWGKPQKVSTSITSFPSSAEIITEPLGVVLIISAWNYPFLLSLDPVIGAVAAGNAVLLKPSEIAPATSSMLARLLPEFVDKSSIKVVEGGVAETTALLEQKWDKILYTGGGKVARIVMAAAAKHLTPVVLELGGKSPVVVDSNVATKRIAVGKWGSNNGQACIAPDYVITPKTFAPKLVRREYVKTVEALKTTLVKFYGKDPLASNDLSRIVNSNHFRRLTDLLDDDKVSDKIVHGGQRDEASLKIAPTVLLDVPLDSLVMNEEIFGPLLPIIVVDDVEEAFDMINSRASPLAAYLFTSNRKLEDKFVRSVSAGGMCINDTALHFANTSLPFGGVGESGMGAYHGKFSFDTFSHKKGVLRRSFQGEVPTRYPPYTRKKQRLLRALLDGDIFGLLLALIGWAR